VLLVVAATARELVGAAGADTLACGIGPVEAAAATARALAERRPEAVLHVGIAGARSLEVGTLVLGTEAVYCDLAAAVPVVDRAEPDAKLLAALRAAFPDAPALPIGTSARVGGAATTLEVEAMEGFGVLRAAELAGVPAVEARVVANEIAEPDRSKWRFDDALAALAEVLPRLVAVASAA
jgi:nucleoside phosphorylase